MSKRSVQSMMRQLHKMMGGAVPRQQGMLYEELRQKIGQDIRDVMVEAGIGYEELSVMLRVSKAKARQMVWNEDLRLSELVKILWRLDAQLYPLIRLTKKKGNNNV